MSDLPDIGAIASHIAVFVLVCIAFRIVDRMRWIGAAQRDIKRRQQAESVLSSHGYVIGQYIPGLGVSDEQLSNACSEASRGGKRLVFTQEGELAGKIAVLSSSDIPRRLDMTKPRLKLVVSNPPFPRMSPCCMMGLLQ